MKKNDDNLHPNCRVSFNGIDLEGEINVIEVNIMPTCERCLNKKSSFVIIPVNPETFCDDCKKQWQHLLIFTEEI